VYQAALKYEASFGIPFANYSKRAIKNLVLKEAARLARQRRFETPLGENPDEHDGPQSGICDDCGHIDTVRDWVGELPEPHATIFHLLYVKGLRQRPAAQVMGVSQPRVAQLHRSLLDLAREALPV
jgi:DNA-directed RNA polymerase specialized sigma subunit